MKFAPGYDSTIRGIRPELRFGVLLADFALLYAGMNLAPFVGDIHSAHQPQLLIITTLLFITGAYAQWRYESARTFDFHDALRLLYGALTGTILALAGVWLLPGPLEHSSGRLVVIGAMLGFALRMFLRIGLVMVRNFILTRRPNAQKVLIVGVGMP
ncbi:MAG TPA: hypothetical protein VFL13_01150, partial [Candidatus Baltobacteraceae bacterium]|nr:hypothetical protein [Candidatus Baltobacteraceae bacterium]